MTDPISTGSSPSQRRATVRSRLSGGVGAALAALLLVSLVALVIGVGRSSDYSGESATSESAGSSGGVEGEAAPAMAREESFDRAALDGALSGGKKAVEPAPFALSDRAVIRTAAMTLLADDVAAARSDLLTITESLGGYVADERSEADRGGRLRSAELTVQVPTDDLDAALERIADVGTETSRSQSTEDVTEQVVDVDSRVDSAEAALRRVRLLLKEANSLGDVIRLEQVLSSRQADLESLLSQQESLAALTSMATLRVSVSEPDSKEPQPAVDDEAGFLAGLSDGWNALKAGYVALATLVGALLPTAVVLGLIALLARLILRRGRWSRRPTSSTAEA
jgi:hypothetical protein